MAYVETPERTLNRFVRQWNNYDPRFRLDDYAVRKNLMDVLSAAMTLLAVAPPEAADNFLKTCERAAQEALPRKMARELEDLGRR